MEIIREVIEEEIIGEDAPGTRRAALGWGAGSAGDQAKKMGLDYLGFGRYGKDGHTTHHSVDGKLQPVKSSATASPAKSKAQPAPAGGKPPRPPVDKTKTNKPAPPSGNDISSKSAEPSTNDHKKPKIHTKIAAAMSKFKINKRGNGGEFKWVDKFNEEGGAYVYDDSQGGHDYTVTIQPITYNLEAGPEDFYSIDMGEFNPNSPFLVKGLNNVKKALETAERGKGKFGSPYASDN